MSYPNTHQWFRRVALGLAVASAIGAGSVAAATNGDDPYQTDIYVRAGDSLGGPDGGPVLSNGLRSNRGRTASDAQANDQQSEIDEALEAQAQAGLSDYLQTQHVWIEGVSDLQDAVPAEG
jgi:hypothetical protein